MLLILLRKEFLLEFRQRYAMSGIVLYVFSMIFVVYIASIKVPPPVWNVLFWLIVLFASINAVVKSFVQESGARQPVLLPDWPTRPCCCWPKSFIIRCCCWS